jgi:hypothetical protein
MMLIYHEVFVIPVAGSGGLVTTPVVDPPGQHQK